jgi:DNA repair protein RecN (Recombination protein N)
MLSELRIRNFALIDQLSVRLGPGLNVLSGETGAGKSIVVGALSLLLGERASSDSVRAGADRASVEGVFELDGHHAVARWLEERGLEAEEGLLILKREVAAEGRSRGWINGSPATASLLGELGGLLVTLHGQHEHQTLLRRDEQRDILDAFGGHQALVGELGVSHAALADLTTRIRGLEDRRREALQRADFLRYQVQEIETVGVEAGEDERLEEEERRLSHSEELLALAATAVEAVSAGGDSAGSTLGSVRRTLDQLVRIDPAQAEMMELFDTAYYALEELGSRLERYLTLVEHDPERLEQVRQRQDLLYRLRSKYGPTLEDVVRTLESARNELALLDDSSWEAAELEKKRASAEAELRRLAGLLTDRRAAAMEQLSREVDRILPELGMEGGRFEVVRVPLRTIGSHGAEEVEFRVSLNRGFEPKPLASVASGGELSRVMLALKTILARLDEVPTLIFDEVDAGIGGRVALHVGDKMRQVAGSHQVLAITHLPQIASPAGAQGGGKRGANGDRRRRAERGGPRSRDRAHAGRGSRQRHVARPRP